MQNGCFLLSAFCERAKPRARRTTRPLPHEQKKTGKDKKRKTRRKGDGKGPQSNLDDYAAIDTHNINLIYLRRNLVEDLIDDAANFHDKVVGAFARIRISGSGQKQDLYRLVQVVGKYLHKMYFVLFWPH